MTITKSNPKGHSKFFVASILEEIKKPITLKFPVIMFYKIISTMQILALFLEIAAGFFQSGIAKWTLLKVIRFFIFRKLFVFTENNVVTGVAFIIFWFAVFANILMLGTVLLGNKLNIPYTERISKWMRHYMVMYQFVLFLPIFVFLLELMDACNDSTASLLGSTSDSVFFILSLILAIFNFFVSLMNLKCFSALYAQKTFTKRNSNLATLDLVFKTFMAVYVVFVENSTAGKWIAISVSIIYGFLVFQTFHRQLPFFQIKVLEAYCQLLGAKIALLMSIFVCGIFDEFWTIDIPDLPVAGFLFTLPFCMVGQKYRMIQTIRGSITFNEKNYRTENDVFIHLLALRILFKKGAEISIKHGKFEASHWNMKLSGVISRHNDHCENTTCGCRTFLETEDSAKGITAKKEKYKDLEVTLMRELYEKGTEKVPHSEAILLNLAQFYLLYLENYLRSYLVLQAFEKKSQKSFETEIMIEYLKKRVQERMELKLSGSGQQGLIAADYEANNLNVTALVQNDILFIQLKKLVHEQVIKQLKFWDLLENFELNTRAIETCCEEIDMIRTRIEKLWDNLSKINQKCLSHFMLYGLYQTLVNNTTKKGEKLLNDYTRMHGVGYQDKEGITNDNLYDSITVVVRISMRRDKIGLIEECSGDMDTMFGYSASELLDNNVATIMSTFFKERHHTFVMNHFELGTENVLNKVKRLYGYHRDGYIFPIFLYVSIYPNIETGLSYMGIMRPRNVYNNYILLKSDGTVDSYSPEIAEYLGLESRKKYNITEICPSFEKIMNAYNYVTKSRYTDLLEEAVEYRAEGGVATKKNEYQVKVSHIESDKDLVRQTEEAPLKQKELSSMIGGEYENASSITAQSKMMATMDTREETGMVRSKDKGTPGKGTKVKQHQKKYRRLNTDDIDEYKKIFDQMSVNGAVLSFLTQKEKVDGSEMKNYLCTVADEIFDHSILRIITLGRNDENIEEKEADSGKNTKENVEKNSPPYNNGKGSSREQSPEQSREHSADQDEIKDIGISEMPFLFEDSQIFRNPFESELERKNSSNKEKAPVNKDNIFSIVSHNPEIPEHPLEISSNRIDVSAVTEPKLKENHSNTRNHTMHFTEAERSGNSKENQEGFNEDANDSKEFIQEMVLNNNFLERNEGSTTTGSTMSMRGGIISKFEALLYKKEEGKTSNKLKSYYLIIGVCLVMAILNTVLTNSNLSHGSQKVQRALSVGRRVDQLLSINYNTRIVDLYLNSYITANRHTSDMGITDFPEYSLANIKTYAESLLEINSDVMNDIEGLYKSSQGKFFYNYVTLNYPSTDMSLNNVKSLSSFEAVDTIALSALEITSGTLSSLTATSDNIAYLLLNTMNELYIEMRNGFKIYQDDLEDTLSNTKAVTLGIAIAVLSVYVLFMVILVRDLSSTHQDKVRFWNSLVKLDTQKGTSHKKMLHIFKDNLENSSNHSQFKKALMDAKKNGTREVKVNKAKEAQINGFKRLKGYKLKNRSYFIVFPFLIVLLLILAYFIISEVSVANEVDNKRVYMEEIVRAENYYQLNMITLNGIYQYVSEGASTQLQGTDVVTAINENLSSLSRLGDFVASFRTKNDFDPKGFIQMNLCETYLSNTEKGKCISVANGMVKNGLNALLTYTKQTLDSMMDIAQQSSGSTSDITTALDQDSLKKLESVLKYLSQGFYLLSENLAHNEENEQDNFQVTQIVILLVFLSILLIMNYFMVWKGFRRLDGQKFDNMKILRVIPAPLILESKMIKTYLLKSFKDDLSSITNKI